MTCREKFKAEHPEIIDFARRLANVDLDHWACPHDYGYADKPDECNTPTDPVTIACVDCWSREVKVTED